jgi:hypothetical protein
MPAKFYLSLTRQKFALCDPKGGPRVPSILQKSEGAAPLCHRMGKSGVGLRAISFSRALSYRFVPKVGALQGILRAHGTFAVFLMAGCYRIADERRMRTAFGRGLC